MENLVLYHFDCSDNVLLTEPYSQCGSRCRNHAFIWWCRINYDNPYPERAQKDALGAYASKDDRQVRAPLAHLLLNICS